jgi:uncharacterized protein YecE (DUF72 family)
MGKIRIGLSGWDYDEWQGGFYPEDLPKRRRLQFTTRRFDTLEVNGTFYSLTSPDACRAWKDAAPPGFVYALKGSRYITHMKRLTDIEASLANFFASGILELGEMLGPVVWQLPRNFAFDAETVDDFLARLPHDTSQAAELAKDHDGRVEEVSFGDGSHHRLRHVLEVRHESFLQPETARIAQRRRVALCSSHSAEWPYIEEITAGFAYLRLHGPGELYASSYRDLDDWAERIESWRGGKTPGPEHRISDLSPPDRKERDVYAYFDNTAEGHAPQNAMRLQELIERR